MDCSMVTCDDTSVHDDINIVLYLCNNACNRQTLALVGES